MMKKLLTLSVCSVLGLSLPALAVDFDLKEEVKKELTGDQKDACEALLCLSSSERPDECRPPIHRYFSITHRKPHKQIEKRRNFLKMCPAVDDDEQMPSLVNAIVNGAGRCDLASLNQATKYQCLRFRDRETGEIHRGSCNPSLPSYCSAYYNHAYTDIAKPKWQCTQFEKEAKIVRVNNQYKLQEVSYCTGGKWVL